MKFYQDGFDWHTQGIVGAEFEHGAVVFFNLDPGIPLCVDTKDKIKPNLLTTRPFTCGVTELNYTLDRL